MKKYALYGLVALLLTLAAVMLWFSKDTTPDTTAADTSNRPASSVGGRPLKAVAAMKFDTGLEHLPPSLRDTDAPTFLIDENGHLVINRGLRNVYDYFLSAISDEPVEILVARIRAYIEHVLKGKPAAAEAEHILDGYIAYKKALIGVQVPAPTDKTKLDIPAIRAEMDQVAALRTQFLSPEVIQAFFGDDDAYDRFTMARIELSQNKNLSAADRARQIDAMEEQLPDSIKQGLKTAKQFQSLQALQDDCKQRHCSDDELHQQRQALVGPAAEARLEALDQQNAAWDARINSWLSQRSTILANKAISDSDRQQQVTDQRNALFTTQEQIQVKMAEEAHDEGSGAAPAAQ